MNKFLILIFEVCVALAAQGELTRTTETQHYIDVIQEIIFTDYKGMFRPGYRSFPETSSLFIWWLAVPIKTSFGIGTRG